MTTHRFNITPVDEHNLAQPSEIIPLISKENEKNSHPPIPPPLPTTFRSINETNKSSPRLINSLLERVKANSSSPNLLHKLDSPSHSISTTILDVQKENEEPDSVHSTINSSIFDTNPQHGITNKFLQELRLKRREIHEKGKDLPIEERIALNRFHYGRDLTRAQDIFDVHFVFNDDDNNNNNNNNFQSSIFNEDTQEKIRTNIFNELDRQRMKQFHKQHRQLILGRALLMFITSLLVFMSITLIYVVMDLYNRANYLNVNLYDKEFISMIYDATTDDV